MANKTLYVGNISWQATKEEVCALFAEFGEVSEVRFIHNRETDQFRGFGFVTMGSEEEAAEAMQKLNGVDFQGRALSVAEARERQTSSKPGSADRHGYT